MRLESEVVRVFLGDLRKDRRLSDSFVTEIEKMLNSGSVTRTALLDLTRTHGNLQNKEH